MSWTTSTNQRPIVRRQNKLPPTSQSCRLQSEVRLWTHNTTPHTMTARPPARWLVDPADFTQMKRSCTSACWGTGGTGLGIWLWISGTILTHLIVTSCRYFQRLTFIQWGWSLIHTAYYCYSYLVYKLHYPWALEAQLFVWWFWRCINIGSHAVTSITTCSDVQCMMGIRVPD